MPESEYNLPSGQESSTLQNITLFGVLQTDQGAILTKMTVKFPVKEDNRLHMVIASEIKEGLDLTLIAEATESLSASKSNPTIKITQFLELVNDNPEFMKRIPVELKSRGAKSTTFHGFGSTKLSATSAIKSVIELGDIIYSIENYNSKGYDRHIIASKGYIDGKAAVLGVMINSYPKQHFNSKFYLHEVIIIEVDSHFMTGTDGGAPVSETTSSNSISNPTDSVKEKQLEIITATNPAPNSYSTWM